MTAVCGVTYANYGSLMRVWKMGVRPPLYFSSSSLAPSPFFRPLPIFTSCLPGTDFGGLESYLFDMSDTYEFMGFMNIFNEGALYNG